MIHLSVLIPTTPDRLPFMLKQQIQFEEQLGLIQKQEGISLGVNKEIYRDIYKDVEVLYFEDDKTASIGFKRNVLKDMARGKYLAYIDSDDRIADDYFSLILEGIKTDVDCCSLKGIITYDGLNPELFEHSIKYKEYYTNKEAINGVMHERFPNHLNSIRSSIARQFNFPEKNHGEDTDWATQIFKSGLIKTEHYIDTILYYYDYRSKK